jgi:hypothetical protein
MGMKDTDIDFKHGNTHVAVSLKPIEWVIIAFIIIGVAYFWLKN